VRTALRKEDSAILCWLLCCLQSINHYHYLPLQSPGRRRRYPSSCGPAEHVPPRCLLRHPRQSASPTAPWRRRSQRTPSAARRRRREGPVQGLVVRSTTSAPAGSDGRAADRWRPDRCPRWPASFVRPVAASRSTARRNPPPPELSHRRRGKDRLRCCRLAGSGGGGLRTGGSWTTMSSHSSTSSSSSLDSTNRATRLPLERNRKWPSQPEIALSNEPSDMHDRLRPWSAKRMSRGVSEMKACTGVEIGEKISCVSAGLRPRYTGASRVWG